MTKITLYYFDAKGRGEIIRLILSAAGVEFEDCRFDHDKWPDYKKDAPFGQAPYIDVDGKKYAQTIAICNYFARVYGFYGSSNKDALFCDQIVHLVQDGIAEIVKFYFEKDEAKKAELVERFKKVLVPKYCGFFEKFLKENKSTGFFLGDKMSYPDMVVYDFIGALVERTDIKDLDTQYPLLKKLKSNVESNPGIKKYQDKQKAKA